MQLLVFVLFFALPIAFCLQCWTGQVTKTANGASEEYLMKIKCDSKFCSNMTTYNRADNITIIDYHCGSELLQLCDASKLGCFDNPSRLANVCCCDTSLCNGAKDHRASCFTQSVTFLVMTLLSLTFVRSHD
uniref:Activin_recp domain-containing protein n=1 Tax=Panagrellus redivivus TaxID=6233 RepID=A0A7E4UYE6_PANRE